MNETIFQAMKAIMATLSDDIEKATVYSHLVTILNELESNADKRFWLGVELAESGA